MRKEAFAERQQMRREALAEHEASASEGCHST
jgi:hypothetical protein